MKEIQAPEVVAIKIQFGELKLHLETLNGFQKINTLWIDLKILPHNLEERAQVSKQV